MDHRPVTAPDRPSSIQLPHLPSGGMAVSARNHPTEPLPHTVRHNRSSQSARGGRSKSPPRGGGVFSRGNASSFARNAVHMPPARPTYAKPVRYSLTGIAQPLFGPDGARAFAEDAVDPEIHLFEGGHFLLESALPEVTELMRDFLARRG